MREREEEKWGMRSGNAGNASNPLLLRFALLVLVIVIMNVNYTVVT